MATIAAAFKSLKLSHPLSSKYPVNNLVIVPARDPSAKPIPISVAEKSTLLNIKGLKYSTPPAPTSAIRRALVINLSALGNCTHQ